MMIREYLLVVVAGLFLSSCTSTSVVMLDDSSKYKPSKNVQILTQFPKRSFKRIAILEARGPVNTPTTDLLADMKDKAAKIGADAVVPTENASRYQQPGIMYNPWLGGYQTLGGGTIPIIKGVAIKYTDDNQHDIIFYIMDSKGMWSEVQRVPLRTGWKVGWALKAKNDKPIHYKTVTTALSSTDKSGKVIQSTIPPYTDDGTGRPIQANIFGDEYYGYYNYNWLITDDWGPSTWNIKVYINNVFSKEFNIEYYKE